MVVEVLECGADGESGEGPEGAVYVGVDPGDDLVRGAVACLEGGLYLGQTLVAMGYVVIERGCGVAEQGAVPGEERCQLSLVGELP